MPTATATRLPTLGEVQAERYSRDLRLYARHAFEVIRPGESFVGGWAFGAICEHLQAVTEGQIRRLIISVPPRFMKSLTTAVFWPSWEWTFRPQTQWIFGTYVEGLTVRDSVLCRRLIRSEWYQERWGDAFSLAGDQNQKMRFENDAGGHRIAIAVPTGTGEGGDRIVADDALSQRQAMSPVYRQRVIDWWEQTMSTRGNNPEETAFVVIGQRLHQKDLTGHLLEKYGSDYDELRLPMEFEPSRSTLTSIGWHDPRTRDGELLHPERFPKSEVESQKKALGAWGTAAQFQQRPTPRKGGLIPVDDLIFVDEPMSGPNVVRIRWWDMAATDNPNPNDGDFTAGVLMATDGERYRIEDVVRGKWGTKTRDRRIEATARRDGRSVDQWSEQEPGSSGKSEALAFRERLAKMGLPAFTEPSTGSKVIRAKPFASAVGVGIVEVVRSTWTAEYVEELQLFPTGANDDQVDGSSGAYNKLVTAASLGVF